MHSAYSACWELHVKLRWVVNDHFFPSTGVFEGWSPLSWKCVVFTLVDEDFVLFRIIACSVGHCIIAWGMCNCMCECMVMIELCKLSLVPVLTLPSCFDTSPTLSLFSLSLSFSQMSWYFTGCLHTLLKHYLSRRQE